MLSVQRSKSRHSKRGGCYGTILREYCEKDHTLGYELLKRMSEVMTRPLQAARAKLVDAQALGGFKAA